MEEKKNNGETLLKIVPGKDSHSQPEQSTQKLSYEKLNQACAELSEQNGQMQKYIQNLHGQLRDLKEAYMMKRLDYLFKVLQYASMFDADFIGSCADEIKEALAIPENQAEQNQK
jgi:hypothetical protein